MSFKKFTSKWGTYAPSCSVRNLPLKFMLFFLDARNIFEKDSFQLSTESKQLSTLVTNLVKLNEKLGSIEVITHTPNERKIVMCLKTLPQVTKESLLSELPKTSNDISNKDFLSKLLEVHKPITGEFPDTQDPAHPDYAEYDISSDFPKHGYLVFHIPETSTIQVKKENFTSSYDVDYKGILKILEELTEILLKQQTYTNLKEEFDKP